MGTVVAVSWQSLTVRAKVGIMAHSALVSITNNARLAVFTIAQRSIAKNTVVALRAKSRISDRLKNWNEAMPRMFVTSRLDTGGAVIPVRTVHTFMTHAVDVLCHKLGTCMNVFWEKDTLSQPSQSAKWRMLRPGAQRLVAIVSRVVFFETGSRVWLG